MPSGGKRERAGRPKGISPGIGPKRKKLMELAAAARMSPLQYLVAVYNDPSEPKTARLQAATAAAPYLHCRLASMAVVAPSRVDADGIPVLDVASPTAQPTGVTTINILSVATDEGEKSETTIEGTATELPNATIEDKPKDDEDKAA